jgi:hypothetical protein
MGYFLDGETCQSDCFSGRWDMSILGYDGNVELSYGNANFVLDFPTLSTYFTGNLTITADLFSMIAEDCDLAVFVPTIDYTTCTLSLAATDDICEEWETMTAFLDGVEATCTEGYTCSCDCSDEFSLPTVSAASALTVTVGMVIALSFF